MKKSKKKNTRKKSALKSGQVVFEYILVIFMIVGVSAAIYIAIKNNLRKPLLTFKSVLEGDVNPQGKNAGSGNKKAGQYYQNVRFGTK